MEHLVDLPTWLGATVVFGLRIVDVSLGTVRTIAVVQGKPKLSLVLGFFEVLIWMTSVSQVLYGVRSNPVLLIAYAGGFAAGNAAGIQIERLLAWGTVEVRIISTGWADEIANALRRDGWRLTTFQGEGRDGPQKLVYAICPRRKMRKFLAVAKSVDSNVMYSINAVRESSEETDTACFALPSFSRVLPHPTGWRAAFKMK